MDYNALQVTGTALLNQNGTPFTLTRAGGTVASGKCFVSKKRVVLEGTTANYTKWVLLPGGIVEPRAGDKLTTQGTTYKVSAVEAVQPADVPVLFKVELE